MPQDNWIELPDSDDICEVFVADGLGFTEHASYVDGQWFAYDDKERSKPLNVSRWKNT